MKKIFFLSCHNKPSGGTKVLNQFVNLFIEKGFESFLVITEKNPQKAAFLKNPCPIISIAEFKEKCQTDSIAITGWQHAEIYQAIKACPAKEKIFWQHGVIIPKYPDFNGEDFFKPGVFTQYWNVSRACADYIKNRYKLPEIKIVSPFFDDETLLKYQKEKDSQKREGILILRRRGQEAISDIVGMFREQKITILPKTFSDSELYEQLIKHKLFVSTDNGVNGKLLIKNRARRWLESARLILKNVRNPKNKNQNSWVKPEKNLLGFPMSACEAAWLETPVAGFAMGGGLEWMTEENMYLAEDGDINSLLAKIKEALEDSETALEKKIESALESVQKFSQENTWKELVKNLNL
jgi:hypothetical protein